MSSDSPQSAFAQQVVLAFLRDELQPVILDLHSMAQRASLFRIGFWASFTPRGFQDIENSYIDAMTRFMSAYKKWYFPDELFSGAGHSYNAQVLADYMTMKPALQEHIHEGFRLLEYIDRVLSGQKSVVYNRVAMSLSVAAITVSVIVAFFQI